MGITRITFECSKFHLNIETEKSYREILVEIKTEKAQELFNIAPELFSTSAKMELNRIK
jgi:hypothetical protein